MRRELSNKFIAAPNGKSLWSINAFVRTVRDIEHHDVVRCAILADELPDKRPRQWIKQAVITLQEATEVYMVEVTAEFHCNKHRLMSCRF